MTTETTTAPFVVFANFPAKVAVKARFAHRRLISEAVEQGLGATAVILGVTPKDEVERYVILTFLPDNPTTPFATHLCEVNGESAALFWGHYTADIGEAVAALKSR